MKNKEAFYSGKSFDYENFYNSINYVDKTGHLKSYIENFKGYVENTPHWLDVGCGAGTNLQHISTLTNFIYGFDIVDESVKRCNKLGFSNVIKHSIVDPFPYESNFFDIVSVIDVLEHLTESDIHIAMTEIYRVCKKGAIFLLASSPKNDKNHTHITIKPISWWKNYYQKYNLVYLEHLKPYGIVLRK
jgi:ubiquinone/menaquinone biosynthesis C-methylase UbiE